jgi:hypothetical protein
MVPLPHDKPTSVKKPWKVWNAITAGAVLGAVAGVLIQMEHVLNPETINGDPFLHTLGEIMIGAIAGGASFAAFAVLRNWAVSNR